MHQGAEEVQHFLRRNILNLVPVDLIARFNSSELLVASALVSVLPTTGFDTSIEVCAKSENARTDLNGKHNHVR